MLAALIFGCAGPEKLARQSEEAFAEGQLQKAYDKARKALKKDGSNERARRAMAAAGGALLEQREDEILALAAAGDTLESSSRCVGRDAFLLELADFGVGLPPDSAFAEEERTIRNAGAEIHYQEGMDELEAGSPKRAFDAFLAANEVVHGYKDVLERITEAGEAAISRVAILPWENQTQVRGLSMDLADKTHAEVARRITPEDFRFTELLDRELVYAEVPVSALERFPREEAIRIGGEIGADQVVAGRYFGLRSQDNVSTYVQRVVRPRQPKDKDAGAWKGKGQTHVEEEMTIIRRQLDVWVQYEFFVLDAASGEVVASRSGTVSATAITVFTDFVHAGPRDDYRLYVEELPKEQPETAKRIDQEWRDHVGKWKLAGFLERAEEARDHRAYRREDDMSKFYNFSHDYPIFLGDLPPAGDLALVALDRVWEPVLDVLRELDE